MRSGRRLGAVLFVLGGVFLVALAWQSWRAVDLEHARRDLQIDRALTEAERILRRAVGTPDVFALVPAERRSAIGSDGVLVDDDVAWLWPADDAGDEDLVVADRLQRAARAEFAGHDPAQAGREFETLLAAPLPSAQRLTVLAAAAWFAQRNAALRLPALRAELDERIAALPPAALARPVVARAVAATLRLPGAVPAWAERLAPCLPHGLLAGVEVPPWRDAQESRLARRALLQSLDAARRTFAWGSEPALHAHDGALCWWLPHEDPAGPVRGQAAQLDIAAWLELVRAAGERGVLPPWPWLVEAEVVANGDANFVGVPFVAGLRATRESALGQRPWLLPALTLLLLAAFGIVGWQRLAAARLQAAAVAAQAEFLTNVTHELKTPLASIRLLGEMLLEGRANGRQPDYYRMLVGEAARLSMLIENVLDLGRAERGDRAYDVRPLDVLTIARETAALLAPVAEPGAAAIGVRANGAPPPASFDRAGLVQALVAVLDNARKYGTGPIDVVVAPGASGRVSLTVRDRGAGVPAAERERIFERFVRGQQQRHGGTPGVGIGLYLARTITRQLGGELSCTAPADGGPGALFCFDLPAATADTQPNQEP